MDCKKNVICELFFKCTFWLIIKSIKTFTGDNFRNICRHNKRRLTLQLLWKFIYEMIMKVWKSYEIDKLWWFFYFSLNWCDYPNLLLNLYSAVLLWTRPGHCGRAAAARTVLRRLRRPHGIKNVWCGAFGEVSKPGLWNSVNVFVILYPKSSK